MWEEILKSKQKLNKINDLSFNMIDANNDGWIERGELEDVMIIAADEMGIERPNKEEIKEIMKELDKNGKGKLTKDDFMVLVLQVLKLLKKYEPISSE